MAQAGNQLRAPSASVWLVMGRGAQSVPLPRAALPLPTPEIRWCHPLMCHAMPCRATPCHAQPCHTKQCRATPCRTAGQATPCRAGQALVRARSPEEVKGRGSAGRRSPGLGGGISAGGVQSHGRLGPGALRWHEGAEQAGWDFKPIGSRSSRQGRGKGAACLVIVLINQACSGQDPTLSTPR